MSAGPYRLNVPVDRGRGPVYVLLHGINSTGHDWDTVVTAMGFDRRCIAVDELGYGRSPKPLDVEYTVDDHVAALRHTLHEIGVDEPFTLVGYSMGGPIALRYAAEYPDEVRRLILISAPFFLDPADIGDDTYASAVFQTVGSKKALALATSQEFTGSKLFSALTSDERRVIQGFINSTDIETDWEILRRNVTNVIKGADFKTDLPRVKAPVTFMIGARDAFIVRSQVDTLRRWSRFMEVRVLADLKADHMLLENVPGLIADEIVKWEDRRLAVAFDRGEGEIFVMLHGVENDGSFWNSVALALSSRARVVSLDLLGFGFSPRPLDVPYGVDDHVASIERTLDSLLGSDARFTLVGHSIGAIIAAGFARRHPERVTRLVLFSPPVRGTAETGSGALDRARAAFVESFGSLREKAVGLTGKRAVRGTLGRERLDRLEPSWRSIESIVENENLADDLASGPPVPVTVVHGSRDPFVVPEYARALADVRDGIEVVTLDAGHDIATERPLDAVAAIDPSVDPGQAAEAIEKAKTDRKLRPPTRGLAAAYSADALLAGAQGLVLVAFGLSLLLLPPEGDLVLMRLAFAVIVLTRSIATITGLFTTRSIRQEQLMSAVSAGVGILLGVFLVSAPEIARSVLFISVAAYLAFTGGVSVFAAYATSHAPGRRRRLLVEGFALLLAALLLLGGSVVVARLVVAVVIIAAVGSGTALITYALTAKRAGGLFSGARLD